MPDEKMNETQYRTLIELINNNSEDHHRALKTLKQDFGEKLEINLKYIGFEIKNMKDVLASHNSRLRKTEEYHIRSEERNKILKEMFSAQKEELKKQKEMCEAHKLKVQRLSIIERWADWVCQHPWKFGIFLFSILTAIVTVSNIIYHLINNQ
jgi:hypothetical protein